MKRIAAVATMVVAIALTGAGGASAAQPSPFESRVSHGRKIRPVAWSGSKAQPSPFESRVSHGRKIRPVAWSGGGARMLASSVLGTEQRVGWIGCSNTRDAVAGYRYHSRGSRLWHAYDAGGGSVDRWSDPNYSLWNIVRRYASAMPTGEVWIQVCTRASQPAENDYEHTLATLRVARSILPNARFYLSGLNGYDGFVCGLTGADGPDRSESAASSVARDTVANPGPEMGDLTAEEVRGDKCHPNDAGRAALGARLMEFFG